MLLYNSSMWKPTVLLKFLWLLKQTPVEHTSGFLCMPWEVYGESHQI